jgi:hypothetical protein
MQQYMGEGGLDARNVIQLLHTIFLSTMNWDQDGRERSS